MSPKLRHTTVPLLVVCDCSKMALQLAQFRLNRTLVATYESNSTRGFLHGRTETVRSVITVMFCFCVITVSEGMFAPYARVCMRVLNGLACDCHSSQLAYLALL